MTLTGADDIVAADAILAAAAVAHERSVRADGEALAVMAAIGLATEALGVLGRGKGLYAVGSLVEVLDYLVIAADEDDLLGAVQIGRNAVRVAVDIIQQAAGCYGVGRAEVGIGKERLAVDLLDFFAGSGLGTVEIVIVAVADELDQTALLYGLGAAVGDGGALFDKALYEGQDFFFGFHIISGHVVASEAFHCFFDDLHVFRGF